LATTFVEGQSLYFVHKANDPNKDAYSGFDGTGLADILHEEDVDEVYVAGLATDYCVKETAEGSLEEGFDTSVFTDLIRGVFGETSVEAIVEMSKEACLMHSDNFTI